MLVFRRFLVVICLIIGIGAAAEEYSCFWEAAKHADEIGIIKSQNRGNDLKVTGFLSGKKSDTKIKFPSWFVWQVRTPAEYLLPLTKNDSGYVICGQRYSVPVLKTGEAGKYNELISQYKKLKPETEKDFLKKLIRDGAFPALDFACVRRLSGLGEFGRVMPKKDCNFWIYTYSQKDMNIGTRRYLLYEISRNNFLNSIPIFENALKDTRLSSMAGYIFVQKDKKTFEKLMLSWLADDKLREFALANSQSMVRNPAYVSAAMKYFNPKDKNNLRYFIPVLCASSAKKAQDFIRTFLSTAKDRKDFMLYLALLKNISESNSTAYTTELKIFMKNHKDDRFVMSGIVYPMILACLCKANDADGYKQTLEYISSLKPESKQPLDSAKVNNFLRVFHSYNSKLNTVEKIKEDIQKKLAAIKLPVAKKAK